MNAGMFNTNMMGMGMMGGMPGMGMGMAPQ
jgi:hypothetical protein